MGERGLLLYYLNSYGSMWVFCMISNGWIVVGMGRVCVEVGGELWKYISVCS